jgi:predicted Zn-dependent peptidase
MARPAPGSVVRHVLPSGLRVLVQRLPGFTSAAVGVFALTGSRDEAETRGGASHLVEHLAFKGTPRRTARAIAEEIDLLGGTLNALTSKEFTSYYARVLGESLPCALDIISDITLHPLLAEEDIARERDVVLQEISMVEDTPEDLVHDLLIEHFWPGHPLGRPIMGTAGTLAALDRAAICDFHSRSYRSAGLLVAAAGDLDPHDFMREVEKRFAGLPAGECGTPRQPPRSSPQLRLVRRELEQVHLCAAFEGIPLASEDRYALHLLNTMLGGGMSSRLFQSIREERGLAYSVYSYHSSFADSGIETIYCGTSREKFAEVMGLILQETGSMGAQRLPEEELSAAKTQLKGNMLLGMESTSNMMNHLARNEIYFGRQIPPEEVVRGIMAVGAEDVRSLAERLLDRRRLAVTVIGDLPEDALDVLRG